MVCCNYAIIIVNVGGVSSPFFHEESNDVIRFHVEWVESGETTKFVINSAITSTDPAEFTNEG